MTNNIKKIFFVLALVTLLVTVGAACAADDANSTSTASDTSVSDAATVSDTASDTVAAEPVATKSNDNKVDTKTIEKEDKNIKTSTKTVEVNDGDELRTAINNAVTDIDTDEYIINLNEGSYTRSTYQFNAGQSQPFITINGNNQLITGVIIFSNKCNFTINELNFKNQLQNSNCNISFNNSTLNGKLVNNGKDSCIILNNSLMNNKITNKGYLIITDDSIFGENFSIDNQGTIIMNDTSKLAFYESTWNGNYTFNNVVVNSQRTNNGNVTFSNSTLNSTITNNGNMTISDDTIFGENFVYSGTGNLIINDINRILPYMSSFNGFTLENVTFTKGVSFGGENTLINCTFEDIVAYQVINNQGTLTMINCTIRNCSLTQADGALISNNGNLNIINTNINNNLINKSGNVYGFIRNIFNNNIANLTLNNITFSDNKITSDTTRSTTLFGFINCDNMNLLSLNNSIFSNNYVNKSNDDQGDGVTYDNDGILIYNANNLEVSNCVFENNTASAIVGTNINVTNCSFKNNTRTVNARSPNSLSAKAILDLNGDNNINNCEFTDNFLNITHSLAGGDVYPANVIKIEKTNQNGSSASGVVSDSIFKNNGIECNSVWLTVNGAAIKATNLTVTNNNFSNNYINSVKGTSASTESYEFDFSSSGYGVDIYADGTSTIRGNNFINSTGNQDVGSIYASGKQSTITISNNTFMNCRANNESIAVVSEDKVIQDNNYINNTIGFKKLNITTPDKVYSNEDITVSLDVELAYPDNYDNNILEKTDYQWYIDGQTNTDKDTQKTVHIGTENVVVYVTPTVSNNRSRVVAISPIVLTDIIITPENINKYVFDGELIGVNQNSKLVFQGQFNNTGEIYSNTNNLLFDGKNATFTNTAFVIEASDVTIQNMNINNTDTSKYIITTTGNNNIIQNNTLTQYNTNGQTAAIYNLNSNNTQTRNNKITVSGPAKAIQYGETAAVANTQAILQEAGYNNTITQNTITVQNSTNPEDDAFSTIEAITAPRQTNTEISYNNITITGARFNYAINTLNNVNNETINDNNINVTGYRYADGIQVGDNAQDINITQNNITITCLNTTPVDEAAISYGIIATSQGGNTANNINITENNININGAVNYGMEIYTATNTNINNNNITLTGVKSMGIGYAHSPNGTITQNTITTNDDSTQPLNGVTEEIQPANTGIKIQQDSENIQIENNTITTNNKAKTDKTIDTDSQNTTIKNNKLTSSTGYGDETTKTISDTTLENNIIETTTTLEIPETITTNTPVTLTTTVTTADGTPINGGTVTFTKGNEAIAQATVTNGIATATHTFTQEEEDVTIVASYTPESTGLSTSSAEVATSIQAPVTQLNIEEIDLTAGETVTLTATVTDQNGNNLNGGKVTFKINGKTIKDASGKVIYAKVVDGIATAEYTVPENLGGQDINITAVYSGTSKYNKETTTITTTVTAPEAKLTITPITSDVQTGSTVTLKAKVALGDKAITTGKIVFKVNGKTVKDANGKVIYAKVDANGEVSVDYTIPESFKSGTYNIEAVFTASGYEKLTDNTTMTVVKS